MTLVRAVRLVRNPYEDTIATDDLIAILERLADDRAATIAARHESGEYPRQSMGFVILDRTAPLWQPSDDTILALITVGPEGDQFIPNAAAKAIEHRDSGVECGVLVYTQPARLPSGSFRYGFSVLLDGTYAGGSGESELQDRRETTTLALEWNYALDSAVRAWEKKRGPGRWYTASDQPGDRYADLWDDHTLFPGSTTA